MMKYIKLILASLLAILFVYQGVLSVNKVESRQFDPDPMTIEAISWSLDGKHIATGHTDGTVRIWNSDSGQLEQTLIGHTDAVITLSWRDDGLQLLSGGFDQTVRLWDTTTGQTLHIFSEFLDLAQ